VGEPHLLALALAFFALEEVLQRGLQVLKPAFYGTLGYFAYPRELLALDRIKRFFQFEGMRRFLASIQGFFDPRQPPIEDKALRPCGTSEIARLLRRGIQTYLMRSVHRSGPSVTLYDSSAVRSRETNLSPFPKIYDTLSFILYGTASQARSSTTDRKQLLQMSWHLGCIVPRLSSKIRRHS